jgi:hypothetical protein
LRDEFSVVRIETRVAKTRSVFERYNIVSDGDLHAAAASLSGLVNGTNGTNNGTNAAQTAGGHSRNARFSS